MSSNTQFTMQDASGSYDWIFEGAYHPGRMSKKHVKRYARSWADELVAQSDFTYQVDRMRNEAQRLEYPRFGYTTGDRLETPAQYIAYWEKQIKRQYREARQNVIAAIEAWLLDVPAPEPPAEFNVQMTIPGDAYNAGYTKVYQRVTGPRGGRRWKVVHTIYTFGVSLPELRLTVGEYKFTQWRNGWPTIFEHFTLNDDGTVTELR